MNNNLKDCLLKQRTKIGYWHLGKVRGGQALFPMKIQSAAVVIGTLMVNYTAANFSTSKIKLSNVINEVFLAGSLFFADVCSSAILPLDL